MVKLWHMFCVLQVIIKKKTTTTFFPASPPESPLLWLLFGFFWFYFVVAKTATIFSQNSNPLANLAGKKKPLKWGFFLQQ